MLKSILILLLVLQTYQKSDVYFTKEISSNKMVEMFQKLNLNLQGNIGLKIILVKLMENISLDLISCKKYMIIQKEHS